MTPQRDTRLVPRFAIADPRRLGPGAVLLLLGCGRGPVTYPPERPLIDARQITEGYCMQRCHRRTQCHLDPGVPTSTCEEACYDDTLARLDDPCWTLWVELMRCVVRELDCSLVVDDDPEIPDGSSCQHWVDRVDACEA